MNSDLTRRADVATAMQPWTPRDAIDEKLLEHAQLRRTALVRLPAHARLPVVGDSGCIEMFVLEGSLRSDRVVHAKGMYVREPVGAREFTTDTGCILFVKQRPARHRARIAVDTRMVVFERSHTAGLWQAPLHGDADGKVALLRFDPGTRIGTHIHDDGEEFFVLAGEVTDEVGSYAAHHWVRQPPGSNHSIASATGCTFFTFAHHLGIA